MSRTRTLQIEVNVEERTAEVTIYERDTGTYQRDSISVSLRSVRPLGGASRAWVLDSYTSNDERASAALRAIAGCFGTIPSEGGEEELCELVNRVAELNPVPREPVEDDEDEEPAEGDPAGMVVGV